MPTLRSIRRNDASQSGVVWDYLAGSLVPAPTANLCVLIAERDNPQYRAALARLQIEHAEALRSGGEKAKEAWSKIQTRALSEAVLLGWWNLEGDDGSPIVYSHDAAEKILADASLWPFRHFVEDAAGIVRGYVAEQEASATGN
jgi:hypothetical protein